MNAPTRPILRWHGGKWRLAPWIIGHFPPHRVYVEPFGGAGSVLMRKSRAYAEVYNDLDSDVVNLFRVLRSSRSVELIRQLQLTPFARADFTEAFGATDNQIEKARRLVIRSFMGFGSNGHNIKRKTGFRANSNRSGTTPAKDWLNYPENLRAVIDRLSGVVVENRDACAVMEQHDSSKTLHYVDPPYLPETRSNLAHSPQAYAHEMTADQHVSLLTFVQELSGMVVLSGYRSALYNDALTGWRRVECLALADGAKERTEVLWLNPACVAALDADQMPLLARARL